MASTDYIGLEKSTNVKELQDTVRKVTAELKRMEDLGDRIIEQTKASNTLLDRANARITELEEIIQIQEETIQAYEVAIQRTVSGIPAPQIFQVGNRLYTPDPDDGGYQTYRTGGKLQRGFGLSVDKDGKAKAYRCEDPDGPLIPKLEYKGGEIEIGDEGFHFEVRLGKKK